MVEGTRKEHQVAPDENTDDASGNISKGHCFQQPCPILRELGIWGNQAWGGEEICCACPYDPKECIYDTLERKRTHRTVLHNRL